MSYVTTHSPTLPSLYLRRSSFSNPYVASPTSQFILQLFFSFSYVTSSSLNSPGEPPMFSGQVFFNENRSNNIIHKNSSTHIDLLRKLYNLLAGSPCFATVNLYLLRKVRALNFSLLLHYYVNSGQLLNSVYIDFCSRRRLRRMCAFKKRQKLPVA